MKYTTVANRTNKIATVHVADCGTLKQGADASGANSERREFSDGLEALEFAHVEISTDYGFCAICLKGVKGLLKAAR